MYKCLRKLYSFSKQFFPQKAASLIVPHYLIIPGFRESLNGNTWFMLKMRLIDKWMFEPLTIWKDFTKVIHIK